MNQEADTPTWRKSTRSQPNNANCVEVATLGGKIAIRDSKDPSGPVLIVSADAFAALIEGIRAGEFD